MQAPPSLLRDDRNAAIAAPAAAEDPLNYEGGIKLPALTDMVVRVVTNGSTGIKATARVADPVGLLPSLAWAPASHSSTRRAWQ